MTDRSDRHENVERPEPLVEERLEGEEDFETSLAQLEDVVRLLESGDLNLDDALAHFSRGVALARACNRRLRAVELEMERLLAEAAEEDADAVRHDGTAAGA